MTVRDDGLQARQEAEKRYEMRSDTQKPHTFDLLTWYHNSKHLHFPHSTRRQSSAPQRRSNYRADSGCVKRMSVAGFAK
jgi:hypothetical protein